MKEIEMNDKNLQSAIEKFKDICRNEFGYLLKDFGFHEIDYPPSEFENKFKIRFVRNDFTVIIEGIHYGTAAMVYLQDLKGRKIFPRLLNPDFQPNPSKKAKYKPTSQLEDIKEEARLLHQYGASLLRGDFAVFESALEKRRLAWAGYEDRSNFGIAVQEAVEAFKNQDWFKIVKSLEPYENRISSRMAKKLKTARENLHLKD